MGSTSSHQGGTASLTPVATTVCSTASYRSFLSSLYILAEVVSFVVGGVTWSTLLFFEYGGPLQNCFLNSVSSDLFEHVAKNYMQGCSDCVFKPQNRNVVVRF